MDKQAGLMMFKESQEIGRTTSNEIAERPSINVRVIMDANRQEYEKMEGGCDPAVSVIVRCRLKDSER